MKAKQDVNLNLWLIAQETLGEINSSDSDSLIYVIGIIIIRVEVPGLPQTWSFQDYMLACPKRILEKLYITKVR